MPKRYEPELDHKPVGWGTERCGDKDVEIERLVAALRSRSKALTEPFKQCGVDLEADDLDAFLDRLQFIIVKFVACCRAHPLRTPRKLLPTVKLIKEDPGSFLARSEDYSPEAAGLVFAEYRRLFPGRPDLAEFEAWLVSEAGSVPTLDPSDIARAADAAIAVLEQQAENWPRGRSAMELVERFSVDLGKLFLGFGGHLRRTVHDGESGPFHAFLTLIAELVRDPLRDTGYTLTPETMVDFARKALLKPKP